MVWVGGVANGKRDIWYLSDGMGNLHFGGFSDGEATGLSFPRLMPSSHTFIFLQAGSVMLATEWFRLRPGGRDSLLHHLHHITWRHWGSPKSLP